MLGKEYQAKVKSASNVLVGIAQVRAGLPSYRAAVAAPPAPRVQTVPRSLVNADGVVYIDPTNTMSTAPSVAITATDTYSGTQDGCFILRKEASATALAIYNPEGKKTSVTLSTNAIPGATTIDGVTFAGTFASAVEGDTWIVAVWSKSAQTKTETGIVSPYSMFAGSQHSVGGLRAASFTPTIDNIATLESGFPSTVDDRIVTSTSVKLSFEALEYSNDVVTHLRNMMNQVMNEHIYCAIPLEVVLRTRGGSLYSFWVPNATITALPSLSPGNDFSTFTWEFGSSDTNELLNPANNADITTFNKWRAAQKQYHELAYTH
jgi:hypothetical protein